MGCYCKERETNPAVADLMRDLPPGWCGRCDICGKPGHTRAHPSLPTTGAWCDEHWQALLAEPGITPDRILMILLILLLTVTIGYQVYQWWR